MKKLTLHETLLGAGLAFLALMSGWLAFAQAEGAAAEPADLERWFDRTFTPILNVCGRHPVFFGLCVLYGIYFLVGVSIVWALRVRFKHDRKNAPYGVLICWNLLELTTVSPWLLARSYWSKLPELPIDHENDCPAADCPLRSAVPLPAFTKDPSRGGP